VSRIRTNTVALGVSFLGTAVLAFLQIKILTNHLTDVNFGAWIAVVGVGALLGTLTELGLPQVIVRYGAKFDAERRTERLRTLWWFALRVHLGAAAVMTALLFWSGPWIAGLLGEGDIDRRLILFGYLAMASGTLRALNNGSFRSLRRMPYVAYLEIAFAVLVTAGYYGFRSTLTVERVLTIFIACSVVVAAAGLAVLLRLLARLPAPCPPDAAPAAVPPVGVAGEVRGYWQGAAAAGIFLVAIEFFDKPLLAGLVSLQLVGVFGVASRLALFPRRLLYVPMQVINPEITHKWESGRRGELAADIRLFLKLELGLGLLLIAPLTLLAKPLIVLVSTPEYLDAAPVLWVFTAVIPLLCLHQPLVLVLRAIGHVWWAFVADAGWLACYLGLGAVLVGGLGLPGFVLGQVVASLLVLTYTLWVFRRKDLPRPEPGFFLKRGAAALAVWAACAAGGWALPADLPLWTLAAACLGLATAANLLMVLGGYLTHDDERRTVDLLAGRGAAARAAAFLFGWPRRLVRGGAGAARLLPLVAAALAAAGCGGGELPPGCTADDDVPAAVREEVEAAAATFYARVRAEDAMGIFQNAAWPVHEKSNLEEFVRQIAAAALRYGLPETPTTERIYLVNIVPGVPIDFPRECGEGEEMVELMLRDHPVQACLEQHGVVNGVTNRYSTLWYRENGVWKLGEFRVRPATVLGYGYEHFVHMAEQQRARGNMRNTALLYELAQDLIMPNPWTRPPLIREIESTLKGVTVNRLPIRVIDRWEVGGESLRVGGLTYTGDGDALGLYLKCYPDEPRPDSTLFREKAGSLYAYVLEEFPEYPEVFRSVTIRAVLPEDPTAGFQWTFPLRRTE
jgi:O-antigen/teichoic acid export membrane protein